MIKIIDMTNKYNAQEVLNIQLSAYKVEAEIIRSSDTPPLKDTVTTLQNCIEIFFGYYETAKLCGVISMKVSTDEVDIHRLIVHPNHFRKGIAQSLLNFIADKFESTTIKVATASKNTPAINFYYKNGFHLIKESKINPQLSLSYFIKKTR